MEEGRFFDDFKVGEVFRTDGITVTESEIIGFAMRYDPQAFHLDVTAASKSPYGGLIASGFHTLSVCFRLFIQKGIIAACSIGRITSYNVCYTKLLRDNSNLVPQRGHRH